MQGESYIDTKDPMAVTASPQRSGQYVE